MESLLPNLTFTRHFVLMSCKSTGIRVLSGLLNYKRNDLHEFQMWCVTINLRVILGFLIFGFLDHFVLELRAAAGQKKRRVQTKDRRTDRQRAMHNARPARPHDFASAMTYACT